MTPRARLWWTMCGQILISLGFMVVTLLYVKHIQHQQDNFETRNRTQLCGIVAPLDDRYQQLPAGADPDAHELAARMHAYRLFLGCK